MRCAADTTARRRNAVAGPELQSKFPIGVGVDSALALGGVADQARALPALKRRRALVKP